MLVVNFVMQDWSSSLFTFTFASGLSLVIFQLPVFQIDSLFWRIILGLFSAVFCYSLFQVIRWKTIKVLLTYRNWIYEPKSFRTKVWGIILKLLIPKKNGLYDFQNYLPSYPLPKLDDTCQRALKVAQPLLNDQEFSLVQDAIQDLKKTNGPLLQEFLEKRYKTEVNWLSELWDKYAYLSSRSPLPIHSNFGTVGDARLSNVPKSNQLSQAANIIYLCMDYKRKIVEGSIKPLLIQGIVPICSERFKYIFSTTRVPGKDIDEIVHYPQSEHIVVFRKGLMYKLNLFEADTDGKRSLLTPKEIQSILQFIVNDADEKSSQTEFFNPGVFTTANRTTWATIRTRLLEDNAASLEIIESAVFCVALDTSDVDSLSEQFHNCLAGNPFNRWFDKSLTVVVTSNATQAINVEHTTAEATFSGRMWENVICSSLYDDDGDATHLGLPTHARLPTPELIQWEMLKYKADVASVEADWNLLEKNLDAKIYFIKKGKSFMKKLRYSPDGFVQMALQLAFYRRHKTTPKTYETATSRLFRLGRTETIRSVSEHSVNFTKSFDDLSIPRHLVIEHLKKAIRHQTLYKYDAMNGVAVDRHLFALFIAGKSMGSIPKLFTLKPFNEYDRLSTSQSPLSYDLELAKNSNIEPVGGGFGPQREDGYGVSYFMDEHKVHFLITSFKSNSETDSLLFAKSIEQAVDDMKVLLETYQ